MTPRETLGLCCVHIPQLMTHLAIYTKRLTLQLRCMPIGILQRVTKSQNVHISNQDGLEKLHNINFVWHRSQGFPEREQSSRNSPFSNQVFWEQYIYCSSNSKFIILWLPSIHQINICREPWFFMIEVMEEFNQNQNWLRNIIPSFNYS